MQELRPQPLLVAQQQAPVEIHADPTGCSFQFDLLGGRKYETACDIARAYLTNAGIGFSIVSADAGAPTTVHVGGAVLTVPEGYGLTGERLKARTDEINTIIKDGLVAARYPAPLPAPASAVEFQEQAAGFDWLLIFAGFAALVVAATALYGPMAAALVELFPTRVRYTALSVPYHVGIGWVGGFMPMTAFAIATATGDVFAGLWYPVVFGVIGIVCCLFLFPETKGRALT